MKTLILYYTKRGSTKQYAEWLGEAIPTSEVANIKDFDRNRLNDFERIVIGSYIYAGKIMALTYIIANWDMLKNKKPILFTVGMLSPEEESSIMTYKNIPDNVRNGLQYVKLPGRMEVNKLNFFEKLITKVIKPGAPFGDFNQKNIQGVLDLVDKQA